MQGSLAWHVIQFGIRFRQYLPSRAWRLVPSVPSVGHAVGALLWYDGGQPVPGLCLQAVEKHCWYG